MFGTYVATKNFVLSHRKLGLNRPLKISKILLNSNKILSFRLLFDTTFYFNNAYAEVLIPLQILSTGKSLESSPNGSSISSAITSRLARI